MRYKIVIDSCGELLDEWKKDPRFESVALTLSVGGENIIDEESSCLPGVSKVSLPVTGEIYESI